MKLLFFSFAPVKSFPLPRSSRKRGKETFFLPLLFRFPPLQVVLRVSLPTPLPSARESYKPFRFPTFLQSQKGGGRRKTLFSPSPSFPLQQPRSPWKWASGKKKDSFLTRRKQLQKILWKKGFGIRTRSGERLWKGEREEALPLRLQLSFLFFPAKLLRETVIGRRKAPPGEEGRGE